jgi:hypothetical protein
LHAFNFDKNSGAAFYTIPGYGLVSLYAPTVKINTIYKSNGIAMNRLCNFFIFFFGNEFLLPYNLPELIFIYTNHRTFLYEDS